MTEITLEKWGVKPRPFIFFPNTIEEGAHNPDFQSDYGEEKKSHPIFFISARLIERIKGIKNFFEAIGEKNVKSCLFYVAGDGEDRVAIEQFVENQRWSEHIRFLGDISSVEMAEHYRKCDAFCLPSWSDSSPLSVLEALSASLPVMISSRCGNHFETVEEGVNGYTFEPKDQKQIKEVFENFLRRRNEWAAMGKESYERYSRLFKKKVVLTRFINEFTEFKASN